jgi:hypothetical protein
MATTSTAMTLSNETVLSEMFTVLPLCKVSAPHYRINVGMVTFGLLPSAHLPLTGSAPFLQRIPCGTVVGLFTCGYHMLELIPEPLTHAPPVACLHAA